MRAGYLPISIFTLFFARNCFVHSQTTTAMSSLAGLYSVAYVTVPSEEVGKKLAHGLVKNKLAACVNIIPNLISIYEWKNEIQEDNELLLMIKTRTDVISNLTDYVIKNHPYETCEVISLLIQDGSSKYLNWIGEIVPPPKKNEN